MKICTKCKRANIPDSANYCPDCGSRELIAGQASGAPGGNPAPGTAATTKITRIGAFAIDLTGMTLVALLTNIPIIGILPAIAVLLYQLLRDYRGASVGKRILGLRVMSLTGSPATMMQGIMRNIIFVLPAFALVIPGLGFLADTAAGFIICLVELILLLTTGSRLGDRIAGTTVIKTR